MESRCLLLCITPCLCCFMLEYNSPLYSLINHPILVIQKHDFHIISFKYKFNLFLPFSITNIYLEFVYVHDMHIRRSNTFSISDQPECNIRASSYDMTCTYVRRKDDKILQIHRRITGFGPRSCLLTNNFLPLFPYSVFSSSLRRCQSCVCGDICFIVFMILLR